MINGELIVDNFAGGGGASTGIEIATGVSPDIAINHDPEAIRMHKANHPYAEHYCEDVWQVDPVAACKGHYVGLAWFSPDCKHFSKAKGGKPKDKNIRGLAWVACRWAGLVRPRVIMLENVEEFKTWGPLNRGHHPIKAKQGVTFQKFVQQLTDLGYEVQFRELVAADYGAPTMRKRFFMIARCDGKPIVWPKPTHGPADSPEVKAGLLKPYVGRIHSWIFHSHVRASSIAPKKLKKSTESGRCVRWRRRQWIALPVESRNSFWITRSRSWSSAITAANVNRGISGSQCRQLRESMVLESLSQNLPRLLTKHMAGTIPARGVE